MSVKLWHDSILLAPPFAYLELFNLSALYFLKIILGVFTALPLIFSLQVGPIS